MGEIIAFRGLGRPARHALSESDGSFFCCCCGETVPTPTPHSDEPCESASTDWEAGGAGRWWFMGAITALLLGA
jgi:hypothetical protein